MEKKESLIITSPAFVDGGVIPKVNTGFDKDISPAFNLHNLDEDTVSLAIMLEDLDIPFFKAYPHWLIWNIPKMDFVPENIPYGPSVDHIGDMKVNIKQGMAYGKNRYRGPKQPAFVRNTHRYRFTIFALDSFIALESTANVKAFKASKNGHILQKGSITGTYKR